MSDFKTAYGPKDRVKIGFTTKGRTRQNFKAECDINNIMARFRKTGVLDFTTRYQAQYADVSSVDFTRAMNMVAQAKSMFFAMPAHVRDRFGNKPESFLAFVQNPNNKEEARALGLLKPEDGGGAVRESSELVQENAARGGVRQAQGRADVPGDAAGGGASAVRAVESSAGPGKA